MIFGYFHEVGKILGFLSIFMKLVKFHEVGKISGFLAFFMKLVKFHDFQLYLQIWQNFMIFGYFTKFEVFLFSKSWPNFMIFVFL